MESESEKSQVPSSSGESSGVKATTDLVVLRQVDLKKIMATQKDLERRIAAQESAKVKPASTNSAALEIIADAFNERKKLVEQLDIALDIARAEIAQLRAQNTELQAKQASRAPENSKKFVDKKEINIQQVEQKLETAKKIKELFQKTVLEVYQAMCELRQPRLRPASVAGCLNCRAENHPWQTCPHPELRPFCHVCRAIGFTTNDCPWPHSEKYLSASHLSPSSQCKQCHRPLSEADPACDVCRTRIIDDAIQRRVEIAIDFEREKQSRKPTAPSTQTTITTDGYKNNSINQLNKNYYARRMLPTFNSLSSARAVSDDYSKRLTGFVQPAKAMVYPQQRIVGSSNYRSTKVVFSPPTSFISSRIYNPSAQCSSSVYVPKTTASVPTVNPTYTAVSPPSYSRSSGTIHTPDGNEGTRPIKFMKLEDPINPPPTLQPNCVDLSSNSEEESEL